jgi:CheY-like chemotaxis protein
VGSPDPAVSDERTRILSVPRELLAPVLGDSFLARGSLEVRSAADLSEALATCASWQPRLIVVRNAIDGDGAIEFCRAARACASGAPPPLLLLVSERVPDHVDIEAACDAHLVGPVAQDQLLATIARLIGVVQRHGQRGASRGQTA